MTILELRDRLTELLEAGVLKDSKLFDDNNQEFHISNIDYNGDLDKFIVSFKEEE